MKFPKKYRRKKISKSYLLNMWSQIVRSETDNSCALCPSKYRVQAHHIIKRGVYVHQGWFLPENGIPLCFKHHYGGIHDPYFPRVKETQEKINAYLEKKGINYDVLYVKCKNRKVDLELVAIYLKELLKKI